MTTIDARRPPGAVRRINDLIWESLDHGGRTDAVAFFCECGDERCFSPVWLAPVDYERGRWEPQWRALASGHVRLPAAAW